MDQYITLNEVASKLRLSKKTLLRWQENKKLPFPYYRLTNGHSRVKLKDVDNYLESVKIG